MPTTPPLSLLELSAHAHGEPVAHRRGAVLGLVARFEIGRRVIRRRPGDLQGLRAGESRRAAAPRSEAPHVQVVERLLEQVGDVLDELGLPVEVADRAELGQDLLAEPVRGGDRGGVEVGYGASQPVAALSHLVNRPGRQQVDHGVGVGGDRIQSRSGQDRGELLLAIDQPLAHAVAQLTGGDPRERDQQQPIERRPLGDIARGQGSDRVRLAGAGARLEHGDARGERAAQVELGEVLDHRHRSLSSSTLSSPRHRRIAWRPNRVASASSHPSSSRGASASRRASGIASPWMSTCSGWRSSLS